MKKNYILVLIILIGLTSCNNVKTNKVLKELNVKTEAYNSYKLSNFKSEMSTLANMSRLDDTFKEKLVDARAIDSVTHNYYSYLDSLKMELKQFDGVKDKTNYLQKQFFEEKQITEKGKAFLSKMDAFKSQLNTIIETSYPTVKALMDSTFNTKPVKVSEDKSEDWLSYQFKGTNNTESIAVLTLLQSKIVTLKTHFMSNIMGDEQFSANAYKVDVVLEKNKFYPGDKVKGKLVINKSTEDLTPKSAMVNGVNVGEKYIKNGEVDIALNAPKKEGEFPVEGELTISQGNLDLTLYFSKTITVVSKPSVKKVVAQKKSVQTKHKTNDAKVNTVTKNTSIPNNINLSNLKTPVITIRDNTANKSGVIYLTRSSFKQSIIDVVIPNSDLKVKVSEFSFKPSNQPTQKIYGNKLNSRAINIINKSKRGRQFKIFNAKIFLIAKPSYHLKAPETVTVELID